MNATTDNQTVVASFISFLRKQNFSEEHFEGIESKKVESHIFSLSCLVAIQCLSETFGLEDKMISSLAVPDLVSLVKGTGNTEKPDKSEAESQKTLGNEFIAANKPEQAVECYSKAIKIDPSNAIYFSNRAAAYSMMGEHFKALEDAKESCKLNPSYSKAFNRLGKAHLALGEPEEAVVAFERALELEPKDANVKASLEAARRAVAGESEEVVETPSSPSGSAGAGLAGLDFSSIMNNPNFMSMAQQMMQSGALNDMLKDPKTKDMVNNFMSNPEMLKKFTGGK